MVEALDVILRLFRGETVTETTEWYTLKEARLHRLPYNHAYPEMAVASAVTPSRVRNALQVQNVTRSASCRRWREWHHGPDDDNSIIGNVGLWH